MLERGNCLLLVLRCYGFTNSWMVSPADGEARDPRPASGLSASSKLRREDENEGRERIFKLVSSLKQTDFSTPPAAKPIKQLLWGGALTMSLGRSIMRVPCAVQ